MITIQNQKFSPGNLLSLIFLCTFAGGFWSVIIGFLISMSFTLFTGEGYTYNTFGFFLSGMVSFAMYPFRDRKAGKINTVYLGVFLYVTLLLLLTAFKPYGVSVDTHPYSYMASLLATGIFCPLTVLGSMKALSKDRLSRLYLEMALAENLRRFGFVFFAMLVLLPLNVLVLTSFKKQQELLLNPLDLAPSFENGFFELFSSYIELFDRFNFGTYLLNSTFVSLTTVTITLLFAIPGAYAVARLKFTGRSFLSRSILLIYLIPSIVLVIPLYAFFSQLGLRNSLIGLMIVYPATTLPVAIYMLQGYFKDLPAELEEAAMMDGCSRVRVIRSVTLPLSLPALASVALYVFMIAWNEFLFAFMFLDNPDIFTLSRGVVSLNSSEVPRQHLMAGAVISTLPIVVIFLYAERFMVKGLTAGGVKG